MSDSDYSSEDYNDDDDDLAEEAMMMAQLGLGGYSPYFSRYSDDDDDEYDLDDYGRTDAEGNPMSKAEIRRREQEVDFYRPDGDMEGKDIDWCISNGFEEIEEGLWSGPWYYRDHGLEVPVRAKGELLPGHKPIPEPPRKPMKQQTFQQATALKEKGNSEFACKRYERACDYYDHALTLFPLVPSRLPKEQKAEMAKIHSNKAECFIRLSKYLHAISEATEALVLDKTHSKSRLRRAKATWRNIGRDLYGVNPIAAGQAIEDLDIVIRQDGEGVEDANKLKAEIEATLEEQIKRMGSISGH